MKRLEKPSGARPVYQSRWRPEDTGHAVLYGASVVAGAVGLSLFVGPVVGALSAVCLVQAACIIELFQHPREAHRYLLEERIEVAVPVQAETQPEKPAKKQLSDAHRRKISEGLRRYHERRKAEKNKVVSLTSRSA